MDKCIACRSRIYRNVNEMDVPVLQNFFETIADLSDFVCSFCVDVIDNWRRMLASQKLHLRDRACPGCRIVKQVRPMSASITHLIIKLNVSASSEICDDCANTGFNTASILSTSSSCKNEMQQNVSVRADNIETTTMEREDSVRRSLSTETTTNSQNSTITDSDSDSYTLEASIIEKQISEPQLSETSSTTSTTSTTNKNRLNDVSSVDSFTWVDTMSQSN